MGYQLVTDRDAKNFTRLAGASSLWLPPRDYKHHAPLVG